MLEKTATVEKESSKQGLQFNIRKTKTLRLGYNVDTLLKVGDKEVEDVSTFTYLGSLVSKNGGAEEDV